MAFLYLTTEQLSFPFERIDQSLIISATDSVAHCGYETLDNVRMSGMSATFRTFGMSFRNPMIGCPGH